MLKLFPKTGDGHHLQQDDVWYGDYNLTELGIPRTLALPPIGFFGGKAGTPKGIYLYTSKR